MFATNQTSTANQDASAGFDWPEPLLIEAIGECYDGTSEWTLAARLHARFLKALIAGETRRAASLRLDLITRCAARDIGLDAIECADKAAFRELTRIVTARYRNSPRLRLQHIRTLRLALDQLPVGRGETPEAVVIAAHAQSHRAPLRLV